MEKENGKHWRTLHWSPWVTVTTYCRRQTRAWSLKNRNVFLTVLEAESWDQGVGMARFWPDPSSRLAPKTHLAGSSGGEARESASSLVSLQSPSQVQFCNPMDCSMPAFPALHYLPEFVQIHVHWFGDAIQPSHPLPPPPSPTLNISQHQGLFQWVSSSYQIAKVLELQLRHQSFQWIFRVDFL